VFPLTMLIKETVIINYYLKFTMTCFLQYLDKGVCGIWNISHSLILQVCCFATMKIFSELAT